MRDKKACEGQPVAVAEQPEVTTVAPLVVRHKGETKEEKQARKHSIKQHNKVIVIIKYTYLYALISVYVMHVMAITRTGKSTLSNMYAQCSSVYIFTFVT